MKNDKKTAKGWNGSNSIVLSKAIVVVFAVMLIFVDIRGYWIIRHLLELSPAYFFVEHALTILLVYLYACSIPAFIVLFQLFGFLSRITKGEVFTKKNIGCLRLVSWCCLAVGGFSLPFISIWPLLALVALAAGLVGLILRVVKNVFEQAVDMKDELELTI